MAEQTQPESTETAKVLTCEAKAAIDRYLRTRLTVLVTGFGLINAAVLGGIYAYAQSQVTAITEQVTNEAVAAAKKQVSENEVIQQAFAKALASSIKKLEDLGRIEGQLDSMNLAIGRYNAQFGTISRQFGEVSQQVQDEQRRLGQLRTEVNTVSGVLTEIRETNKFIDLVAALKTLFDTETGTPEGGDLGTKLTQIHDLLQKIKTATEELDGKHQQLSERVNGKLGIGEEFCIRFSSSDKYLISDPGQTENVFLSNWANYNQIKGKENVWVKAIRTP